MTGTETRVAQRRARPHGDIVVAIAIDTAMSVVDQLTGDPV